MVEQRVLLLRVALFTGDAATLTSAFLLASLLRWGEPWVQAWDRALPGWQVSIPLYLLAVLYTFRLAGLYRIRAHWTGDAELSRTLRVAGLTALATVALLYVVRLPDVSRLFLTAFFALSCLGLVATRVTLRWGFRLLQERPARLRHLLVVGAGATASRFARGVEAHPEVGVRVVGFAADEGELAGRTRLGGLDDVPALLTSHVIDELAVCLPFAQWSRIDEIVAEAEEQGKAVRILVGDLERAIAKGRIEQFDGMPLLSLTSTPDNSLRLGVKRVIDIVVSVTGLVLLAPVIALCAAALRLDSRGPVLFAQTRIGLHGRPFAIRKLRTMVCGAEAMRDELEARNEREGPAFKMAADPRVTRVGRFLRRSSLDEVPQLWNVLLGQMSLVGPRPPLPDEVARYDRWHRRRLSMKPGVTGLWQVSAREDAAFDSWVHLDLHYIDRWTLRADLAILARTVPTVLKMTGR